METKNRARKQSAGVKRAKVWGVFRPLGETVWDEKTATRLVQFSKKTESGGDHSQYEDTGGRAVTKFPPRSNRLRARLKKNTERKTKKRRLMATIGKPRTSH